MTVLSAQTIQRVCLNARMIEPFYGRTVHHGKTFGLSAAGYDVRVAFDRYRIARMFSPQFEPPGHTFLLAATVEHFIMPKNIIGIVHDKSSWARKGLAVQNTVIEPGWRGYLTLELTYHGDKELFIYEHDPIAQIVFHQLDESTDRPYSGKYQDQKWGPQPAIDE